jgi:exosortase
MTVDAKKLTGAGLIAAAIVILYWQVFARLIDAWIVDGNYSHGWLILPIALYFVWERRAKLEATPIRPSWFGLVVLAGGILVLLAGVLGSELFLARTSLLGVLGGIILFLFGWKYLRILAFPLAFLLLAIPIPAIVFNKIAFPLQLFASKVGESTIAAFNIPVLREGNVLVLANTQLEVAEACSGIRSLVSLLTLGIVYAYFSDSRAWVRAVIVLSTVPVAILANGARVAGTGIAAHYFGPGAAEGFYHEFAGWAIFIIAFVMMLAIQKIVVRFAPPPRTPPSAVEAPAV